ncbi:hypothetical protein [Actinokineospora globicatena]|uniref:Uncharacterized protein n=1 Tax=Actinokineospora globicatena TaxID=103729 RepID=A0A9W6QM74_9PSEU|nr:hypothetical protein [Actinokineospora globicatena]GLW91124.1 hypothetical protein Aglo03_19400 [Actinokineospora globicatena]
MDSRRESDARFEEFRRQHHSPRRRQWRYRDGDENDSLIAGAVVGLIGYGMCVFALGMKQGPFLDETRAVLKVFLPDDWFAPGNTTGVTGLRAFLIPFAIVTFVLLTTGRWWLTRSAARGDDEYAYSGLVYGITVLRTFLLLESAMLYIGAAGVTNPDVVGEGGGIDAPAWSWPWFLTSVLPWVILAVGLFGASTMSVDRARARAHRIEIRRR